MIDGDDPKYVNDEMINPALDFIHKHLQSGNEVFIYCSLGESRSPSIALMYMLEHGLIERNSNTFNLFRTKYYPISHQKNGYLLYIRSDGDLSTANLRFLTVMGNG
jgi:protein-tyrosine phosphatase